MSSHYAVNASDLIHDVIGEALRAAKLDNYTKALDELDKPERWQTWTLGMLVISACSFSAPLGMLMLPCLKKELYDRIMIFLIALGIGALSGSSMFIMLPQAFHLTELDDFDYHSKAAIVVGALYVFFTVDRLLQYGLELRRRRQGKRKVHTSTIASLINDASKSKKCSCNLALHHQASNSSAAERPNPLANGIPPSVIVVDQPTDHQKLSVADKERATLAEEVELAMLSNAFARTFSSRRRVAVMSADCIEIRDPSHRGNEMTTRNSFLNSVNEDLSRSQNNFYEAVQNDPTHKNDDEVSVSVKILEKHVIDPATIEVASVAYMIIFGTSANNFVDGMSMGAAFSDSILRGISIGVAVVSQQFPQELGTLAILINSGLGFRRTLLYNMIPIFLSYIGFGFGVVLDNVDDSYDDYVFSISSGMYLYIFLGTLIPEIREGCNELIKKDMKESLVVTVLQYLGITSGVCFMYYMSTVGGVEV